MELQLAYVRALDGRKAAERFIVSVAGLPYEQHRRPDGTVILVPSDAPATEASFWAIKLEVDDWAVFAGFSPYLRQSSLALGSRGARELFESIYRMSAGDGFVRSPAHATPTEGGLAITILGEVELSTL